MMMLWRTGVEVVGVRVGGWIWVGGLGFDRREGRWVRREVRRLYRHHTYITLAYQSTK
jgi:hypothetical protein